MKRTIISGSFAKKVAASAVALSITVPFVACSKISSALNSDSSSESTESTTEMSGAEVASGEDGVHGLIAEYSDSDLDTDWSEDEDTVITCSGDSAESSSDSSDAIEVGDKTITIKAEGTYIFEGDYEGQIIVEASDNEKVHLVFNNFNLTGDMAPLNVVTADKVIITLADDTENSVTDSSDYTFEADEDEPDAAIFADCDLTINGEGSLTVNGNYDTGIRSKGDLKIISGTIDVTAVDSGIKGKDSVVIKSGTISVAADANDAIKATNDEDADKGYVIIDDGDITINAGDDAIHAETYLSIHGGTINIESCAEGIEGQYVDIDDGDITINASDDCINATTPDSSTTTSTDTQSTASNSETDDSTANAPSFDGTMPSGEAPSGDVPSGTRPTGDMPTGDMPSDFTGGGNFGGGGAEAVVDAYINIYGGSINMVFNGGSGDGLDSNGTISIEGGTVYFSSASVTPINSMDAGIDANGDVTYSGGSLFFAGASSGMMGGSMGTTTWSSAAALVYFDNLVQEGTEVVVTDSDGTEVLSFTPATSYGCVFICDDSLSSGNTYTVTSGDQSVEITLEDQLTTAGTASASSSENFQGGGQMPGGQMPGGRGSDTGTTSQETTEADESV